MILVRMNRLFYLFGILTLFFIPFVVPALSSVEMQPGEIEIVREAQIIPIFLAGEILIYFFFGLFSGGAASVYRLILYSFTVAFARFLICLVGGGVFASIRMIPQSYALLLFWMGNPVAILLQIFFLMLLAPYVVSVVAPGILSEDGHRILLGEAEAYKPMSAVSFHSEGAPVGGFVRVYTFPEMGQLLSNMTGIEGYVIYSWEGLVIWQGLRVRFDAERLAVSSQREWRHFREVQVALGLGEAEKLIAQTPEHYFIHLSLAPKFFAVLLFRRDVEIGDVLGRLKYIERTAQELFSMKYSPLL